MQREIIKTEDGSTTIRIPDLEENYHSSHGAVQEAKHVFVKHGLKAISKDSVRVFELGFGTGLNALLSLKFGVENDINIQYFGLEAYPVDIELINELNYVEIIGEEYGEAFHKMHVATWNKPGQISSQFELTKFEEKIEELKIDVEPFDVVYFDAFGHRAQPEMWDISVLKKMSDLLVDGGLLVTYAARGQFKRDLKSLGFEIESLPGPPGKREMTRAVKRTTLNS